MGNTLHWHFDFKLEIKMPWIEETVMSQKQEFIKQVLAKKCSFSDICHRFKISRKTGYKILNRYRAEGPTSLTSQSRKPHKSPNKTPAEIEAQIINVRLEYPTWGARKIETVLRKNNLIDVPSISTISEILKRNHYICPKESLKRKKLIRFEREASNDLWQIDFKGKFQLQTKLPCYPLTIIDDYSRFCPCIQSCENEQFSTVYKQLIKVFETYGMPEQMNFDNGNPWGNSQLFRHTKLTVWLMRLGIKVTHSRPRHPQTNGKIERFHRTLKKDILHKKIITDHAHAQLIFDEWRDIYNYKRPHEAIGMRTPAEKFEISLRKYPKKIPNITYGVGALIRKVRGNGYVSYEGQEYHVGEPFSGFQIEIKAHKDIGLFDIYFDKFKIYSYKLEA